MNAIALSAPVASQIVASVPGGVTLSCHARIGLLAVRSLYQELLLYPKPGLVSMVDSGSHADMDASTFLRSLFSLRRYFVEAAAAGSEAASFEHLRQLGIRAETRMLAATGGVNTHRGAIFTLGLLCAAAGFCMQREIVLTDETLRAALMGQWGKALHEHAETEPGPVPTNGQRVAARHAQGGARWEAASGMPSLFELAVPRLRMRLASGAPREHALIDALFVLMAGIGDTNLYHRRGAAGAELVRTRATEFIARGGTAAEGWRATALHLHGLFIGHRLSPGGAADLLAATCFVEAVTGGAI